ncbi:hypothetical protein F5Y05DRAFT_65066 [Hypoxylon sp. FL0543]|nr:hypothetical protein F5Y05DRAFT_65066 [Hypoxylon sp. FL0543]
MTAVTACFKLPVASLPFPVSASTSEVVMCNWCRGPPGAIVAANHLVRKLLSYLSPNKRPPSRLDVSNRMPQIDWPVSIYSYLCSCSCNVIGYFGVHDGRRYLERGNADSDAAIVRSSSAAIPPQASFHL